MATEVGVEAGAEGFEAVAKAQSAVGESASALDLLSGGRPFTSSRHALLSFLVAALGGAESGLPGVPDWLWPTEAAPATLEVAA